MFKTAFLTETAKEKVQIEVIRYRLAQKQRQDNETRLQHSHKINVKGQNIELSTENQARTFRQKVQNVQINIKCQEFQEHPKKAKGKVKC